MFAVIKTGGKQYRVAAQDMLKIDRPTIDFVSLAKGMGVEARAVKSADEFNKALAEAIPERGPRLIEVRM